MKKAFWHFSIILSVFFLLWYALGCVNWVADGDKVERLSQQAEVALGDVYWAFFESTNVVIENDETLVPLNKIVDHVAETNDFEPSKIKIHVIHNTEVNAFALPDGHLVLHSGLIQHAINQEELIGVVCHEMAHIELRHVVKKLIKEVGLTVLVAMTTGDSGFGVIQESAKVLTSAAFDRGYEREADLKAVDYLINAGVDPIPFALFLAKLGVEEEEMPEYLGWAKTHPDPKERSTYLLAYCESKNQKFESILSEVEWVQLKGSLY